MPAEGPPLVARTRRVDRDLDLLALSGGEGPLLERSRVGLAGAGTSVETTTDRVHEVLASITVDDDVNVPGSGPVAFGALPFRRDEPGRLVIPEIVWGRADDGTRWVTTIGPTGAPVRDLAELCTPPVGGERTGPGRITVRPARPAGWWCELVATATKTMREAGPAGLRKVVLARELLAEADRPFDRRAVLAQLRAAYPDCYLFHVEGFLGASPELLVGRAGDVVRAQPMAGTAPRGGDPTADARLAAALFASPTYRREHQITIDMVYDTLLPWCSYLDYEAEPSVVGVANVQHLATVVEGRLSQPAPSILELVRALHPTPAVNGWPRDLAYDWIAANEQLERGPYAGAVGWLDGSGNGTWSVSIRCASIDGSTARLWAGNGIVADSDPATELAETQAKLQAVLSALTRL